jgi:hypothetical protein
MHRPTNTLINVLIGKAIIETLLVGAIAVGFYVSAFPPTFHGWGEVVPASRSISGWAVNNASAWERVDVQLFVDGKFVATQTANESRVDVKAAGWARDEWHGYSFQLPSVAPGLHQAHVYAVHGSGNEERYTLQLLGDPLAFEVRSDGTWNPVGGNSVLKR